jgi:hypothetical protein
VKHYETASYGCLYVHGCYFSADVANTLNFPDDGNHCQPWVFDNLSNLFTTNYPVKPGFDLPGRRKGGMFLVFQLEDGSYLAIVPICGPQTLSWLNVAPDGRLFLDVGSLGTQTITGEVPLFAWSRSTNVYDACRPLGPTPSPAGWFVGSAGRYE